MKTYNIDKDLLVANLYSKKEAFISGHKALYNLRSILRDKLRIKSSLIPVDIILAINNNFIESNSGTNVKNLINSLDHSSTGVRYYLNDLVEEGWIDLKHDLVDKRIKLLFPSDKTIHFFSEIQR